jgi:hypothetical protein
MADHKSVSELLTLASSILATAANEIRDTPLEPTKEHIDIINNALSLIDEIQQKIYKAEPQLAPDHLKRHSPLPADVNRKFGEILIKANALCDIGEPDKAIELYKKFISEDPPPFIVGLAESRIDMIKNGSHKEFSL